MAKVTITLEDVGPISVLFTTTIDGTENLGDVAPASIIFAATIRALYESGKLAELSADMLQNVVAGRPFSDVSLSPTLGDSE